jgi:hypothetical protein
MFQYSSQQTHFTQVNGKTTEQSELVQVKNGKGTITVTKVHDGKKAMKTHPLTQQQIKNIQLKRFMPGLFRPCLDHCDRTLGLPLEMTKKAKQSRRRMRLRKHATKKRSK